VNGNATLADAERLLSAFLSRDNSSTRRNYESALEDYRRYSKVRCREQAVADLLAAGPAKASERIMRYKTVMLGKHDQRGKLINGRGLSPSAVNLRITVLRSLIKKARRIGMVQWELDVKNVALELVHDVRGPSDELLNKMLDAAKACPGAEGRRDYAILRLAAELGLQRREIVGLDLEDIDSSVADQEFTENRAAQDMAHGDHSRGPAGEGKRAGEGGGSKVLPAQRFSHGSAVH
jgi:integrase